MEKMEDDSKSLFVDTNVLAYLGLVNSPFHEAAKTKLSNYAHLGYDFWVSRQIIREYLVVMSRALAEQNAYNPAQLITDTAKFFSQFQLANDTEETTDALFKLIEKYKVQGKPVHDCNIVATMKVHSITALLTNNPSDFKRYDEGFELISL